MKPENLGVSYLTTRTYSNIACYSVYGPYSNITCQSSTHIPAHFIQYVDGYISFEEIRKSADSPQIVSVQAWSNLNFILGSRDYLEGLVLFDRIAGQPKLPSGCTPANAQRVSIKLNFISDPQRVRGRGLNLFFCKLKFSPSTRATPRDEAREEYIFCLSLPACELVYQEICEYYRDT